MALSAGTLIRAALAPRLSSVTAGALGFPAADPGTRSHLDRIPETVVYGFEAALEARGPAELQRRVDLLSPDLHGFAYEGATMAYTVLDATGRGRRVRDLLEGPGRQHLLLAYIGIGFAMARLPRRLWGRVLPDLDVRPHHPTLSWLAVDGYGFDLAYFHHTRRAEPAARPRPWPWLGDERYFARAADQGLGRALWFVHGADPGRVARVVGRFDPARRDDLWSGVGLAATFAGPAGLAADRLPLLAGEYAGGLGVGAVLAARARVEAGYVPEHSRSVLHAVTGLTPAAADRIVDDAEETAGLPGTPAYERWRSNIREALAGAAGLHHGDRSAGRGRPSGIRQVEAPDGDGQP